jgi:predicted dehydrogenase
MLKAAIVGFGWWGKQIATCLKDSDRIDVVTVVDVDPNAVGPVADAMGLPVIGRYDDALGDRGIDAVILATPHGLHEEQVLAAASAGKQIFCEKPLALSADAAKRMLEACDEKGIVLGIGHERRFEGALEEMKRMADDGELGTLLHVEMNWSHNRFAGAPASGWRQDPTQAPAGTLTALGVHLTDYMQSVAGPVAEVSARMAHRSPDFPGDDIISIQFGLKSGATAYICNIATAPFYHRIGLFGDRGWAEAREVSNVDMPDPAQLIWCGMDEEIHTRTYKHRDVVRANLEAWADAVEGRSEYRFTREQKLHNVQILEAIVTSAATNTVQRIG